MTERLDPAASACADLEADLVLLHYGDLDGAERARLQAHAANCAGCSGYLNELATLLPLTDKTDTPPQEFWMNYNRELRHKIDAAVENKSWWQEFHGDFQTRLPVRPRHRRGGGPGADLHPRWRPVVWQERHAGRRVD